MSFGRPEELWLRAVDGLCSPDELAELGSVDVPRGLRSVVAEVLRAPESVRVADRVMAELGVAREFWSDVGPVLREAAGQSLGGRAMADRVDAEMGFARDASVRGAEVADAIRDMAGPSPALWASVANAIGAEQEAFDVGALLREGAAARGGLADAVLGRLALSTDGGVVTGVVAVGAGSNVASGTSARDSFWKRYTMPLTGLAAAAAMLLAATTPVQRAPFVYELAQVNRVQIEEISSGDNVMVQVLQFDDDAPPIIFIDDGATL